MDEDTEDMLIKTGGVTKPGEKPNSLMSKESREAVSIHYNNRL